MTSHDRQAQPKHNMSNATPRILYIEDTVDNQVLISRVLMVEGYEVLIANNGVEGLEILETNTPDLILMDINMPELDGLTVTSRIKSKEHLAKVPVIALTAKVMRGDREKALEAGCDGFIQKPIDVDNFPNQIAHFLEGRPQ